MLVSHNFGEKVLGKYCPIMKRSALHLWFSLSICRTIKNATEHWTPLLLKHSSLPSPVPFFLPHIHSPAGQGTRTQEPFASLNASTLPLTVHRESRPSYHIPVPHTIRDVSKHSSSPLPSTSAGVHKSHLAILYTCFANRTSSSARLGRARPPARTAARPPTPPAPAKLSPSANRPKQS